MNDAIRRNMALFSIGTVMKLTELTARQIRYYEQHELIEPARTASNQRLFSFNDVERLLEIKALIEKGLNIAGIKQVMKPLGPESEESTVVSEQSEQERRSRNVKQLRDLLKEGLAERRPGKTLMIQGQLSHFYSKK